MELRAEAVRESIVTIKNESLKENLLTKLRYLLYYTVQYAKLGLYAVLGLGAYISFYLLPNPIIQAITILVVTLSNLRALVLLRQIAFIQEAKFIYKHSISKE